MFEKTSSYQGVSPRPAAGSEGDVRAAGLRPRQTALKAIEWCDLSARLEAARDLRLALRHEARRHIEDTAASVSDAAAQYFRTLEQSKRLVNLAASDEHKDYAPIVPEAESKAAAAALCAGGVGDDTKDEQ
ncbi:MAG: hypothetical protein ACK4IS_08120 [Erythrobacter sp.]